MIRSHEEKFCNCRIFFQKSRILKILTLIIYKEIQDFPIWKLNFENLKIKIKHRNWKFRNDRILKTCILYKISNLTKRKFCNSRIFFQKSRILKIIILIVRIMIRSHEKKFCNCRIFFQKRRILKILNFIIFREIRDFNIWKLNCENIKIKIKHRNWKFRNDRILKTLILYKSFEFFKNEILKP